MKKRTMLFEQFNQFSALLPILESAEAEISDTKDDLKDFTEELEKDGIPKDKIDATVSAAALLQALDNDGDTSKLDADKLKKDVKEALSTNGNELNESAEGIIHIIEVIGNIAGNSALLEFICEKVESLGGKKMDPSKVKEIILNIVGALKKVTGLPAKAIEKFFEFVGGKLGLNFAGKKALELVGMVAVIAFFFAMGVVHFPVLGTGVMWWLLSLTGLLGKSVELFRIGKEIYHLIKGGDAKEIEDEIKGVTPDELAKMAGA